MADGDLFITARVELPAIVVAKPTTGTATHSKPTTGQAQPRPKGTAT